MSANAFIADNGPDDGRKRRKTVLNKTVRFDLGDLRDDLEADGEGNEAIDQIPNPGIISSSTAAKGPTLGPGAASTANEDAETRTTVVKSSAVGHGQCAATTNAKARASDVDAADKAPLEVAKTASPAHGKTYSRGEQQSAYDDPAKAREQAKLGATAEQESDDDSDDNIVVARPRTAIAKSIEPVAPSPERVETRAELDEDVDTLHDALGSEDELSLPVRPVNARSTYTTAAAPSKMVVRSIEGDTYQNLLSQFNLNKGGRKREAMKAPASIGLAKGVEARPKRAPKPRKFGDVVDVRTLTPSSSGTDGDTEREQYSQRRQRWYGG